MWFEQFEGRSWGLQDFYRMSKFCSTKCEVQKMYCTTALRKLNFSPTPLARLGSLRTDIDSVFVSLPPTVVPILSFDLSGLYRPRLYPALADDFVG